MRRDEDVGFRSLWVPVKMTGEREKVCEDEGKGPLELGEDSGVEGVAR